MIESGMFKDIAKINAEAIQGLQPKISVWSNGEARDGLGATNSAMKETTLVYGALPPLFQTVHEHTSMLPPAWMGSLPSPGAGKAITNQPEN